MHFAKCAFCNITLLGAQEDSFKQRGTFCLAHKSSSQPFRFLPYFLPLAPNTTRYNMVQDKTWKILKPLQIKDFGTRRDYLTRCFLNSSPVSSTRTKALNRNRFRAFRHFAGKLNRKIFQNGRKSCRFRDFGEKKKHLLHGQLQPVRGVLFYLCTISSVYRPFAAWGNMALVAFRSLFPCSSVRYSAIWFSWKISKQVVWPVSCHSW